MNKKWEKWNKNIGGPFVGGKRKEGINYLTLRGKRSPPNIREIGRNLEKGKLDLIKTIEEE